MWFAELEFPQPLYDYIGITAMIFSRTNPPLGFYVYLYLREDGTPYYVGKGKKLRAWAKHNVNLPKDESRIVFVARNLSEAEAHLLEKRLISSYGRKSNETGILRNLTDGGEGISGYKHTTESNEKNRIANSGPNHPHYGLRGKEHFNYGRKSPERSKRMSGAGNPIHRPEVKAKQKINTPRGDKHWMKSAAGREIVKGENNPRCDTTAYHFVHIDGRSEVCTRYALYTKYNLTRKSVRELVNGRLSVHKGWSIYSTA